MDPFWAVLADVWWIGPATIGVGAMTYLTLRSERVRSFRRLDVDAAKHALREAQASVTRTKGSLRVARAEVGRLEAERAAGRVTSAEVSVARRHLQASQQEAKAAAAAVRSHRAQLSAARAMLPHAASDPAKLPLARLMAEHDAVVVAWMQYETDPAKLIAFPAMSDVRVATTAAFLADLEASHRLRPATPKTRIALPQYTQYRDTVRRLERSYAVAEREAWRLAGAGIPGGGDPAPAAPVWSEVAQTAIARSAQALTRATEAALAAYERTRAAAQHPEPRTAAPPTGDPATKPVWPVPSRSRTTPRE